MTPIRPFHSQPTNLLWIRLCQEALQFSSISHHLPFVFVSLCVIDSVEYDLIVDMIFLEVEENKQNLYMKKP
jgi:hypothetical protein